MTQRARFWRKVVRQWERSGLSQAAFCRQQRLPLGSFGWWKHQLKRRRVAIRNPKPAAGVRRSQTDPAFVPVKLAAMRTPVSLGASESPGSCFEIVLSKGRVLRIPAQFDAEQFRRLLEIVESTPC